MLFAAAARLALIEALCPTASITSNANFPTIAGKRVLDSRRVEIEDLERDANGDYVRTPVIGVFTANAQSDLRSDSSSYDDRQATVTLEIMAELAILASNDGEQFADAEASTDAEADLLLSALVAQIRRVIEIAPQGEIFRKVTKGAVRRFQSQPDVMPQIGVRFARHFITIEIEIDDDQYDYAGGLPEPLKTLSELLPAGSYAAAQLADLSNKFGQVNTENLAEVSISLEDATSPIAGANLTE